MLNKQIKEDFTKEDAVFIWDNMPVDKLTELLPTYPCDTGMQLEGVTFDCLGRNTQRGICEDLKIIYKENPWLKKWLMKHKNKQVAKDEKIVAEVICPFCILWEEILHVLYKVKGECPLCFGTQKIQAILTSKSYNEIKLNWMKKKGVQK